MVSSGGIYLGLLYNLLHPISSFYERKSPLVTVGMEGSFRRNISGRLYHMTLVAQNIPQGTFISRRVVIWEDVGLLKLPLLIFQRACFRKH